MNERHSYFIRDEITVAGISRISAGLDQLDSAIAARCCEHLDLVLWRLRHHTRERYWIVLIDDPTPDAHAFSESLDGPGEIRITTGLLNALVALSARAAIILAESGFMGGVMPHFHRDTMGGPDGEERDLGSFAEFSLCDDKRASTGLTVGHLHQLGAEIAETPFLLVNTLRIAASAIEFAVLHEMGHFDAGHDEARRIQRARKDPNFLQTSCFRPSINVQRIFEHQADIFALRLMIATSDYRPFRDEGGIVGLAPETRTELNFASYLGAALNFTLASLCRAPSPSPGKDIDLVRQVRGEHPLPATRLRFADAQIRAELIDPAIGRKLWPDPPELLDVQLKSASATLLFLALTTISSNWRTAIASGDPDNPSINMQYWMIDESDLAESLSYINEETEREVMELMLASGQQAPKKSGGDRGQRKAKASLIVSPWWRFW